MTLLNEAKHRPTNEVCEQLVPYKTIGTTNIQILSLTLNFAKPPGNHCREHKCITKDDHKMACHDERIIFIRKPALYPSKNTSKCWSSTGTLKPRSSPQANVTQKSEEDSGNKNTLQRKPGSESSLPRKT